MTISNIGHRRPYTARPRHVDVADTAPLALVHLLTEKYPALTERPDLLRLAVHVLRTPYRDGDLVIVEAGLLAEIVGAAPPRTRKKAVVGPVLSAFERALRDAKSPEDAAEVVRVPAQRGLRRATGIRVRFPDAVEAVAAAVRGVPANDEITIDGWCRIPVDGRVHPIADTSQLRAEMLASLPDPSEAPELSRALQAYLHALGVRVFQGLRDEIQRPETGRYVRTHYSGVTRDGRDRQADICDHLTQILRQPVPIYKTSPRTARISAVGRNATSLPAALRKYLTDRIGWVEFDLAHSQLACNVAAWDVGPARAALEDPDYRFWDDLIDHACPGHRAYSEGDIELYRQLKRALKRAVYGVSFGMRERNIRHLGLLSEGQKENAVEVASLLAQTCSSTVEAVGARLVAHPVVSSMLAARRVQMRAVQKEGGRTDVFGVFHALTPGRKGRPQVKAVRPRHVLARVAQAQEMDLLRTVIEDAIRESEKRREDGTRVRPRYRIVLWQHDGFTVSFKGRSEAEREAVTDRLRGLVAERASTLGIPTRLE